MLELGIDYIPLLAHIKMPDDMKNARLEFKNLPQELIDKITASLD